MLGPGFGLGLQPMMNVHRGEVWRLSRALQASAQVQQDMGVEPAAIGDPIARGGRMAGQNPA